MDEGIVIPIAGMIMVITIVLGIPLLRSYIRRSEQRELRGGVGGNSDERLERIEQAIDAMAVEVERIAEGQRYVTKLLADRPPERIGIASGSERQS